MLEYMEKIYPDKLENNHHFYQRIFYFRIFLRNFIKENNIKDHELAIIGHKTNF